MTRSQKIQILHIRCHGNPARMIEQAVDEILVLTEQVKLLQTRRVKRK